MAIGQTQRRKPKQTQNLKATHLQIRLRRELRDTILEEDCTEEDLLEDNSSDEETTDPSLLFEGKYSPVALGLQSLVLNPVLGAVFDRKPRVRWIVDLSEGCIPQCIDRRTTERDKERQLLIAAAVGWQNEFCKTLDPLKLRLLSVEDLKENLIDECGIQTDRVSEVIGDQIFYLKRSEDIPPVVLAASVLLQDQVGNSTGVSRAALQEALRKIIYIEKVEGKFLKDSEIVKSVNEILPYGSISVKNLTDYRYNNKGKLSSFPSRPQRKKAAGNA